MNTWLPSPQTLSMYPRIVLSGYLSVPELPITTVSQGQKFELALTWIP